MSRRKNLKNKIKPQAKQNNNKTNQNQQNKPKSIKQTNKILQESPSIRCHLTSRMFPPSHLWKFSMRHTRSLFFLPLLIVDALTRYTVRPFSFYHFSRAQFCTSKTDLYLQLYFCNLSLVFLVLPAKWCYFSCTFFFDVCWITLKPSALP